MWLECTAGADRWKLRLKKALSHSCLVVNNNGLKESFLFRIYYKRSPDFDRPDPLHWIPLRLSPTTKNPKVLSRSEIFGGWKLLVSLLQLLPPWDHRQKSGNTALVMWHITRTTVLNGNKTAVRVRLDLVTSGGLCLYSTGMWIMGDGKRSKSVKTFPSFFLIFPRIPAFSSTIICFLNAQNF